MQSVKVALRTKALATPSLVSELGGSYFYHRNPDKPISKILTSEDVALVTFWLVAGSPDEEVPRADEVYQMDIWSKTAAKNDEVADILIATFNQKPLTITGRRLGRIVHIAPVIEMYEPDTEIHHKAIQFRITSYPTS